MLWDRGLSGFSLLRLSGDLTAPVAALCILFRIGFADLTFGMLMIHAFTMDPRWLKVRWS